MSTVTETTKQAEEFVVYSEEEVQGADDKSTGKPDSALSLDTSTPPPQTSNNRIDSFPRTLPLPASSVLSPTSAAQHTDFLPSLSGQIPPSPFAPEDLVSPPEPETPASKMLVMNENNYSLVTEDGKAQTPLAELAGTDFDQAVAVRRRGASVGGEEIVEGIAELAVNDEPTPISAKRLSREPVDPETLKARKDDPAIVASLPGTPSAEDFQVARSHEGSNFNPEYPNETKVVS